MNGTSRFFNIIPALCAAVALSKGNISAIAKETAKRSKSR